MNLLHYRHHKPSTCFGQLLWPYSVRCFLKDVLHRTKQSTDKYTILSLKNKVENMLRYKIQIKIFVLNAMSVGVFKCCVSQITIHVVRCYCVCQPHVPLKMATIGGQNMQEAYNIYKVINSHVFMCTCWFYSHNKSSLHGHELFKTEKCPTGKSYTHL
jgi:hypothetical protein